MNKKIILLIFIIISSFCLINSVCAIEQNDTVIGSSEIDNEESIQDFEANDTLASESNDDANLEQSNDENIISHDSDAPWVEFYTPSSLQEVSGVVDIDLNVESHSEVKYAEVSIQNVENKKIYFTGKDTNPSDGWGFKWDTSDAPNGRYYLTAHVENILELEDSWSILIILNNKERNTQILIDDSVVILGESNSISAILYDGNSAPLSNKTIEFAIDGKTYYGRTGSDGGTIIQFTPTEMKNYPVSTKFKGDNIYSSSQKSATLKTFSNDNTTRVSINDTVGNTNGWVLLNANLKAPGFQENITNKLIKFFINNTEVGSALTDGHGNAQFNYTVSEVGGEYILSAQYGDFKSYAKFKVPESKLYVSMNATTYSKDGLFTIGDQFKVTYLINNEKGFDVAENVVLSYAVPDSIKYVSSNASQGVVIYDADEKKLVWNIGNVSDESCKIEIVFQNIKPNRNNLTAQLSTITYDKYINNSVPTRYLTVHDYKLVGSDLNKYYSGSEKYVAYLVDEKGNYISGAVIKLTFNNKVYTLKTNNKGCIEVDTNLKVGKYTVKLDCRHLSITNKIVIKSILITKDLTKKKAKTVKFTAKLLNNKGKVVKNKKVTFKVKGKKYKVKTNKKGVATLKLKNLKVGKYTIYTSYGKLTVKNIIKIKK